MSPSRTPSDTSGAPSGRRGRPVAGTEDARRDAVLDAALAQLVETGADQLTMAAVARRAASSKETLYRWFGDRDGLFAALIQRNADRSAAQVEHRLDASTLDLTPEGVRTTLVEYARALLSLLTGQPSVALNRAAMNDPSLRTLLLQQGRHRVGPLVESYLSHADQAGALKVATVGGASQAFEMLYGLVVRDTQIRVLLGEPPPTPAEISVRAQVAVTQFGALCGMAD